jgi:hypothetical protein
VGTKNAAGVIGRPRGVSAMQIVRDDFVPQLPAPHIPPPLPGLQVYRTLATAEAALTPSFASRLTLQPAGPAWPPFASSSASLPPPSRFVGGSFATTKMRQPESTPAPPAPGLATR